MGIVEGGLLCKQYLPVQCCANENRQNGCECIVKGSDALGTSPNVGSTIIVKHNGVFPTGELRYPVYWRQLDSMQENTQVGGTSACC